MWAVDERGRFITSHFDLLNEEGEKFSPRHPYVFTPWDNHMFIMDWRTNIVYEFDLASTLETEPSGVDGLWYPVDEPPVLLRSFKPVLASPES